MEQNNIPSFEDVLKAKELIQPFIHKTPVLSSETINNLAGNDIYFKCENFQKVGAFKYRGATNAVLNLTPSQAEAGVITHSSGNHAQALALAAKKNGIKAVIVMPETSPKVKIDAVAGYGAEIVFCKPTLDSRETTVNKLMRKNNYTFIHPYNNPYVIAGQGTAAMELLEEVRDLDAVIAPIGGGGLMSGTLLAVKGITSNIKVFGAEPQGANDAYLSLIKGEIVPSIDPTTIADGLLTSLGSITFEIIRKHIEKIICVNDYDASVALKLIWERMKIIVEPSSVFALGAVFKEEFTLKNKKIGIILSGGNADIRLCSALIKVA